MARKEHFTLRLPSDTLRRLTREAAMTGTPKTALAERYLEEGMRAAQHPGIVFRDGAAGRRPGIAWLGLDVWEIIEKVHSFDGDVQETAEYLAIVPEMIEIALGYYRDYPEEINCWIEANAAMFEEHEAAERREHALA